MNLNSGHYIAQLVKSLVKYLKLLQPDDTLLVGQVYRFISYQGNSKTQFVAKKCMKLGKLLIERVVIEPVNEAVVAPVSTAPRNIDDPNFRYIFC
ncbi:hypothetical protein Hanom_Chr07g00580211 [Helianthus anomalus]